MTKRGKRSGPGRPPLPEKMRRTRSLQVKLRASQYDELCQLARGRGLTVAGYVYGILYTKGGRLKAG